MHKNINKKRKIILILIIASIIMGVVDAVIQPGYMMKSLVKIIVFLVMPLLYMRFDQECELKKLFIPNRRGLQFAIPLGIAIYALIVGGYLLLKNIFDFSSITTSLESGVGVNRDNFVWVALYISFANSMLEEFFFRGFGFLTLKKVSSRKLAYHVSALIFALYHIAMMIGWFDIVMVLLVLIGLYIGGMIFNCFNEKCNNIYPSWLIHICANLAINTVGFMLFGIL